MASNSGVKKSSHTKDDHSKLVELDELAKKDSISSAKIQRAAGQADVRDKRRSTDKPPELHDGGQPNHVGSIDQGSSSMPLHNSVIESIERDDTPMPEAGPLNQAGEGSSSNVHERPSMAGHPQYRNNLSPQARGASEPRDPELLASLDPSDDDEEAGSVVDGWGTLRGSTFVILQYGPRHGARYKVKYKHGYTNGHMKNISKKSLRISQLTAGPDNESWRYTKHNVVGIYGVASEERKKPNSECKSDPCTWLKIKWKDLWPEDTKKTQYSCSWIPRSDFLRFCNGKRAADAKIKEVWGKQEERYHRVLQSDAGRRNEDRSPTPCPLGSAARQSPERQPTRLNSPAIYLSPTPQDEVHHSFTAQLRPGQGASANPINLEEDEAAHNRASSGAALSSNPNTVHNMSDLVIGQRAIRTEAEFIAQWEKRERWDQMDDIQREARLTVAQAMYDLYKDTITRNIQPQGFANHPIGQGPGLAVAAY